MSEEISGMRGDWYGPGIVPEIGQRYEFQDFIGASFIATVAGIYLNHPGHLPIRLEFKDRGAFETNLPIRFRDAKEF